MPVREGLVRIEARGIAGRPRLDRRPGISGMKRGFAVPGAIDPVRDIPTAQHRDRSLNDSHVHVLENARQRTAIAAPEIGKDRDGLTGRIAPDHRAIPRTPGPLPCASFRGAEGPLNPCRLTPNVSPPSP